MDFVNNQFWHVPAGAMMSSGRDHWKSDSGKPLAQGGCQSSFSPWDPQVDMYSTGMASISCQSMPYPYPTSIPPILDTWDKVQAEVNGKVKRFLSVSMVLNLMLLLRRRAVFFNSFFLFSYLNRNRNRKVRKKGAPTVKLTALLVVLQLGLVPW